MKWAKRFTIAFLVFFAVIAGFGIWLESQYTVPILMYHSIAENPDGRNDTVSPANFRRQMEYLVVHKYQVLSLNDLLAALKSSKELPRRTVVITFDDGNENNFTNAFPVLRYFKMPAAFFVPTARIGTPGFLSWEQVLLMADNGMEIGSHGLTEAYLPGLPPDKQQLEIIESKRILEERLQKPVNFLAYPIGGFDSQIKDIVRRAGYKAAMATNRGADRTQRDLYELKRIKISDKNVSDFILAVKFSGISNRFARYKKPR